jgi:hypothetical protein
MSDARIFEKHCVGVQFHKGRWDVEVTVTYSDGSTATWVASADSGYTEGSGIWWGTEAEYAEAQEGLMRR